MLVPSVVCSCWPGLNSTNIITILVLLYSSIIRESAKVVFDHPIFDARKEVDGIVDSNDVPEEWKQLLPTQGHGTNPFKKEKSTLFNANLPLSTEECSGGAECTVYYRGHDEIRKLKKSLSESQRRTGQLSSPPYLSSNDVLCGEVCAILGATSVLLCMDWRPVLERKDFFGYAVLFLYCTYPSQLPSMHQLHVERYWDGMMRMAMQPMVS